MRWIVDPIDGTVNFLYGIPQYAVCVAAEVDGVVVVGVVIDVAKGLEFVAHANADETVVATCNGERLGVRGPTPLAHRLISSGFAYDPELRSLQARALVELIPQIRDLRRFGSCALDICAVAAGQMDGYVEEGVNLWDYAAAGLVARGAGARLETAVGVGGLPLVLCAPGHGFDELREAISRAGYLASGPSASAIWTPVPGS